ncbi:secondary thiamine-phosphate synthase enzyme YjbQ [Altererythrobacter sp. KTW20L]|uniref:secondary thiamine-phosphate synthase enzyme YjbQ n=1 Tax=Altererythrobacter sp. KTW20L TaxID=2942210 RepID=UPI0020BF6C9B|nr:secondary thiamine-phosphate synthase enzyme YjbQ [Altererythrobacter sp. KTW20L]MCL6250902.1 secondary thiamine-phosphate synthase enzyme YjbQ [Altererythrobacter sp. KTW20L]
MHQHQTQLTIRTPGKALVEFTHDVAHWIAATGIDTGLVTLFCRHTSASLLINENAAPAVQRDLLRWLDRLAPENAGYEHDDEGPDDMPAHLRAALTGVSLQVPVAGGCMVLGTWQGIYLAEHRAMPHNRQVVVHLVGE